MSAVTNQGVISVIGLIRSFIVVRLLSPDDYGIIGITAAVGSSFSIFQNLGLGVGVAKEAAQASGLHKLRLVAIVVLAVRFTMLLPLMALLIFVGSPQAVSTFKLPQLQYYILLYAIFILVSSPGDILGYILTGASRFRSYFLLRLFNELVQTAVVCSLIWYWKVEGFFIGQAVAGGIYTVVSTVVVWRSIGGTIERVSWSEVRSLLKSVFKTSLSVYVSKLARGFSLQIPILVSGIYMPIASVGLIKFGMQAGGYFATFISAAQVITLPRMTHFLKERGQDFLFMKFGENFRRLTSAVFILLTGTIMFAPELIVVVGGARYSQSFRPFQLVVVSYAFMTLADNIFSGIHFPLNRERSYVLSYIIYFLISALSSCSIIFWMKTPDYALYGICLGAVAHYGMAVFQTKRYGMLFPILLNVSLRVLVVLFLSMLGVMAAHTRTERFVLGGVTLAIVIADLVRNDLEVMKKIIQRIGGGIKQF